MKKECSEKGAHLLNLWLAHYEAIRTVGDYILGTYEKEEAHDKISEIANELENLEKQGLVSQNEYEELSNLISDIHSNLEEDKAPEIREALDKVGKKAYNKMFDEVIVCECGEALAIEEKLGKEALAKILAPKIEGELIECPYCFTKFPHSGFPELQVCPQCGAELLV